MPEHPKVYSEIKSSEDGGARAAREIAELETRYPSLLKHMRRDVEELLATRQISRAKELSAATGQRFNHSEFPMYFTGNLDASIVLVHLNPKQPDLEQELYEGDFGFASFEEYFDAHAHFGEYAYGSRSTGDHYSRFDAKQVRFLRPSGLIDFLDEDQPRAKETNLEAAIDKKLQMELVPYGSANFSTSGFTRKVLQPEFDRLMEVISAAERSYVLFCGSVFEPVLSPYITQDYEFRLEKADGTKEKNKSKFANLRIPFGGREIKAGLAHTWPRQGIPMGAYGREVFSRYR